MTGNMLPIYRRKLAIEEVDLSLLVMAVLGQFGQKDPLPADERIDFFAGLLLLAEDILVDHVCGSGGRKVFSKQGQSVVPGFRLASNALPPTTGYSFKEQGEAIQGVLIGDVLHILVRLNGVYKHLHGIVVLLAMESRRTIAEAAFRLLLRRLLQLRHQSTYRLDQFGELLISHLDRHFDKMSLSCLFAAFP